MKVALVNSRQDKAGVNIRHHIEQLLDTDQSGTWRESGRTYEFFDIEERLIYADRVDAGMDVDLVIFLSRHSSVNPVPALTVHVTGNFAEAELGGSPRTLTPAAPVMMQATLRSLARHCPEGYRVSYEVTHHGPTGLVHPSFFVEIGSTEKEWSDPVAGRAVAEAVLSAVPVNAIPLIGIGGTHYAPRETDIALTSRGAFGHIASSPRQVAALDKEMVQAMFRQSGAVAAYIDRKAVSHSDLERLAGILDSLGILRLSESEITSLGNVSWDSYLAIRKMADAITPNARCYIHDLHGSGEPVLVRANPELVAEAIRSDEPGLIRELGILPIVHISTQDNRLLPEFIAFGNHSQIINDLNTLCVKIIRSNEITATERDYLIITKVRFDPKKARDLGIPQGPYYKKLAAGNTVEIDGRVVTPDMVASGSEVRIHIPGLEKFS
jgi:D-aminoacyl-tRNA deacylase